MKPNKDIQKQYEPETIKVFSTGEGGRDLIKEITTGFSYNENADVFTGSETVSDLQGKRIYYTQTIYKNGFIQNEEKNESDLEKIELKTISKKSYFYDQNEKLLKVENAMDGTNQTEIEHYNYVDNVVWRIIQGSDSHNDMSVYGEKIDAVTKKLVRGCSVHTSQLNEKGDAGVFYFINLKAINYDALGNIVLIADAEYRFIPESQFKFSGQSDFSQFDKLPDAYRAQTTRTENEFDGKLQMSEISHTEYIDSADKSDTKVIFLYNHENQLEKMYRVSKQNYNGDEIQERTSTTYTYNDQGRVATEETYTNDNLVEKLAYEYSKP